MQKGDDKTFPKSHLKQPSAFTSLFQTFKLKPGDHIPHRALSSFFTGVPAILSSALTLLPRSTEALPSAATRNISHAAHIQTPRLALSSSLPLDHYLPPQTDFIDYPTQLWKPSNFLSSKSLNIWIWLLLALPGLFFRHKTSNLDHLLGWSMSLFLLYLLQFLILWRIWIIHPSISMSCSIAARHATEIHIQKSPFTPIGSLEL